MKLVISIATTLSGFVFASLTAIYSDAMRQFISSALGLTVETIVGYGLLSIVIIWIAAGMISLVWNIKHKTIRPPLDPEFSHINARLFYPPKRRWHKERVLMKHWWEIWKQSPSRHKLVLVKDLKKAYWVGDYAWSLIAEGKISWISEDEQDLKEWCGKKSYLLIEEEATEHNLLEAFCDAKILNKKENYERGEAILFKTCYRGELTYGFFSNQIFTPGGKLFSNGRDRVSIRAPQTLDSDDPNVQGKLNGYDTYDFRDC